MTYCLGIRLNSGLVLASDSRTNAGVDYVSTYSKMHVFRPAADRLFVILSAGNLATTQAVLNRIQRDLDEARPDQPSLASIPRMFEVAEYIGEISWSVQHRHAEALRQRSASGDASFILGGQIGDGPHDLFLVYPEGNCITASPETPFLQIGETKYGKPILDRVITPATSLEDAARCALVSLDSTMRSNISVGPPIDLAICERDTFDIQHRLNLKLASPYYASLQKRWNDGIRRAFTRLPRFDWEPPPDK